MYKIPENILDVSNSIVLFCYKVYGEDPYVESIAKKIASENNIKYYDITVDSTELDVSGKNIIVIGNPTVDNINAFQNLPESTKLYIVKDYTDIDTIIYDGILTFGDTITLDLVE